MPDRDRIIGRNKVLNSTGLSRSRICGKTAEETFPAWTKTRLGGLVAMMLTSIVVMLGLVCLYNRSFLRPVLAPCQRS
jgi:predicted DNA-binding transcriptional regulator AlpA